MLLACWQLKEGRVGGRAWAGLGWQWPLGQPGPLRREGDPSLGGEWDHTGAPYDSWP